MRLIISILFLPIHAKLVVHVVSQKRSFKYNKIKDSTYFLMKLDPQFNQVHTNILMMPELPTASIAYCLLLQEQRHKEISQEIRKSNQISNDSMAFFSDLRKYYNHPSHKPSENNTKSHSNTKKRQYFCDHQIDWPYYGPVLQDSWLSTYSQISFF